MTKKTEHRETKQNVKKEGKKENKKKRKSRREEREGGERTRKKSFKEDKASVKELVFPEERRCPPCRCY
jgi:hypothetical protein